VLAKDALGCIRWEGAASATLVSDDVLPLHVLLGAVDPPECP
jgi:hypothetical protein